MCPFRNVGWPHYTKIQDIIPTGVGARVGGHHIYWGLYCAPTFQADSRWNGCQFHVDSIHSIWNLFGWGPSHLGVSFHVYSIWKFNGISIFHGILLWNPGGIHHNLIHGFHIMPHGFHIIPHGFHIMPHGFHIMPHGFHIISHGFHNIPYGFHIIPQYSTWIPHISTLIAKQYLNISPGVIKQILHFVQSTGLGHMTRLNQ